MPRQPRQDAPGALHHVMLRGIERQPIFRDNRDRLDLLDRLARVLPECGAHCFAWTLMPNHVHLVVQSGQTSISTVMRRVNTGYAVKFNLRHDRVGYLFQNRFGSRLVADEADLTGLVRYVHLNPLRAALVGGLDELAVYPWCGHAALAGRLPPRAFHAVARTLSLFGDAPAQARAELAAWMAAGLEDAREPGADPPVDAAARAQPPALEDALQLVARRYAVPVADIRSGCKRPSVVLARAAVCRLAAERLGLRPRELAASLGVSLSAASRALARGRRLAAAVDESAG
jgi:REP element-mobilizing transposase RayT